MNKVCLALVKISLVILEVYNRNTVFLFRIFLLVYGGIVRLKCGDTQAETSIRFSPKRTSPF